MGHDHDHDHDHHHPVAQSFPALRTRALESLLLEKGVIASDTVDRVIALYEQDVGPLNGARVVARAWVDPGYRERLLADATPAILELGIGGMQGENMVAVENTDDVHNVVVCTLCSCYPWPVLGLPPYWYKAPAYRARVVVEPRVVLREFGVEVPDDVEVKVWDSSAEIRYLVVPQRPEGTDGLTEEQLAALVTRDSMIGVGLAKAPGEA
ncbi:MAG: nitrile hydratase subunit alpha [Thermoleophilia bacterium]